MRQRGLFGLTDHLAHLSAKGDPLEVLAGAVDFELFRLILTDALAYADGAKGGRPPYDPVTMFKALVLQAQNNLSDERMEYLIRDRLSWMRFLGFDLGAPTPDANTIRMFRERLTEAGALDVLFDAFDQHLRGSGYLAMEGQIVDATLVAAPRQRNTDAEKAAVKEGKTADEIWPEKPAKARQKDTDARWTVKFKRGRPAADGKPQIDIATPTFGYKSSIAIDKRYGFIRKGKTTSAARHDGKMLKDVVTTDNTASGVWADTAYRSKDNEKWLTSMGRKSNIHRKKPAGKPKSEALKRANRIKSRVRAHVEHVFARQKGPMALFIRTIGIKRAAAKITLANIAYNMHRFIFHERRKAMA